ncbi:MAG TPA: YIP1 family protein [Nitrolancea sp.]
MQRGMDTVSQRMIGAAMLNLDAYEAVERDVRANKTALFIVIGTAIFTGIGGLTSDGLRGLFAGVIAAIVSWILYAIAAYLIGTKIFKTSATQSTLGECLRTLGFAQTPSFFRILSGIPILGALISIIVDIWVLVTTVIALRQALDFSTGRAIGTAVVAWIVYIIPYIILVAIIT